MERLTSNKPVADMMPMIELAHNSCYIDEKSYMYVTFAIPIITTKRTL